MASDDPRRPEDRDTDQTPPVRPESAGEYDDLTETAEFLPPEIGEEELIGLRGGSGLPTGPRSVVPLEEESSSLVSRYLFPTEKFRGEWKKHWIHLLPQFFVGAARPVGVGWAGGLAGH